MPKLMTKQTLIDKANKKVIIATSISAFVVAFSLVASQALLSQMLYQNRIVSAKKAALTQLSSNQEAVQNLNSFYASFVSSEQNVIGGSPEGGGPRDGDNAKIVLDALPSEYDFPALATSLEKLLTEQGVTIENISGTDDEVAQSGSGIVSGNPQPVPIPFQISAKGSYQNIQNVAKTFESSIRPIQLQSFAISSGEKGEVTITMVAQTYYQPAKTFVIGTQVIK